MFDTAMSHLRGQRIANRQAQVNKTKLVELRADVARLENALDLFVSATKGNPAFDHLIDQVNLERSGTPTTGFAAAWTRAESVASLEGIASSSPNDDFFSEDQFDQRARNWLLASK